MKNHERTNEDRWLTLVAGLLVFDGDLAITNICTNYNKDGGIKFSGHKEKCGEFKGVAFVMDKYQAEALDSCDSIPEVYECYREMEFFPQDDGEGEG